jgi:hypothetical protein
VDWVVRRKGKRQLKGQASGTQQQRRRQSNVQSQGGMVWAALGSFSGGTHATASRAMRRPFGGAMMMAGARSATPPLYL